MSESARSFDAGRQRPRWRRWLWLPAITLVAAWLACDSSNPVAPKAPTNGGGGGGGTQSVTVTLAADPTRLEAGSTEFSAISVTVSQTSDQQPPPDGTMVTINTNLGNFGADAQGNAVQLVNLELVSGVASVNLLPGTDLGTATVLAQVGGAVGQLAIEVVETTLAIAALVPASGVPEGGDQVMIQGEGFRQPLQVRFGSVEATVVEVSSETALVVETPASVTPVATGETLAVDVFITTALDRPNPRTTTLAGGFTYSPEAPPPLFLLEVTPAAGNVAGGDRVILHGGGFAAPIQVDFGGRAGQNAVVESASVIRVTTPGAMDPTAVETVDVTLVNALDQAAPPSVTLAGAFTYTPDAVPALFLSAIDPPSGTVDGGNKVTLSGGGFEAPVRVQFGDQVGLSAKVESTGRVTVVTPPATDPSAASVVDVTLVNALDDAEPRSTVLPGAFRYVPDSVLGIQEVQPSVGDANGGEQVSIVGSGFESPLRVDFGGIAGVSPTFVNSTKITVTVPQPAPALMLGELRAVDVAVTIFPAAGEQAVTLAGGYTYQAEAPADPVVVSAIVPSQGVYTGGSTIKVLGSGFTDPVTVELGGIRQSGEVFKNSIEISFTTVGVAVGACPDDGRLPQQGLKVTNINSGDSGTGDLTFSYTVELPLLTSVSPSSGAQIGNLLLLVSGSSFVTPARVTFLSGAQEAAAQVVSVNSGQIQVLTPAVDDTFLAQVTCAIDSDTDGFQLLPTSVDVRVLHLDTGCTDTLPNAFTLQPTNSACQGGPPP